MTIEIVIPPQVRAGRALLGWSQEDLARKAGVAITTVRDVEAEKRAETAAAGEVVRALQNGGVEFVPGSTTGGPGVRLARDRPNVIRRPQTMSAWDGLPVDIEFQGQRFTAFVTIEILDDLAEIDSESHPSLQDYLRIFDHYRGTILDGIRVAFERGATWSRDHQQLRVRAIDVRDLVPDDEWDQLVIVNPKVMGGMPVFAGSRVPIEIVLSSLEAGVDFEELKLSYPFLTPAHLGAARAYEQEHPRTGARVSGSRVPSAWKAKSRRVTRRVPKE
jgi:uncharacterized protein (DUF433 family)/transcriptional regulator with XRE-family HTH domain